MSKKLELHTTYSPSTDDPRKLKLFEDEDGHAMLQAVRMDTDRTVTMYLPDETLKEIADWINHFRMTHA